MDDENYKKMSDEDLPVLPVKDLSEKEKYVDLKYGSICVVKLMISCIFIYTSIGYAAHARDA